MTAPSRTRFLMLALLAIGTMINYLDRTVLGIAAPSLTQELGLTPAIMGVMFSAFSWAYALGQIPGGVFLDRMGSKLTYFCAVTVWSLFTLLQSAASGVYSLMGLRLGLGLSEAPCFPVNSRVVAAWFPMQERARATAVYTVGEYLGLAGFGPALFWITRRFGWRAMFLAVGAAGLLFGLAWWKLYRDPAHALRRPANPRPVFLDPSAPASRIPPDLGSLARPIRRQLHAGVLSHLVSHLSGERTPPPLDHRRLVLRAPLPSRRRRTSYLADGFPTRSSSEPARPTSPANYP